MRTTDGIWLGLDRCNIAWMRRIPANVLRVASVPVGVGVGLCTAQLITGVRPECALFSGGPPAVLCPLPNFFARYTFTTWQCVVFGGGAAVTLLALSLVDSLTNALRVLSVPVGVGIGLWTAQLRSLPYCPPYGRCAAYMGMAPLTFAPWQCGLMGAGAAVVLLLLSLDGGPIAIAKVMQSGLKNHPLAPSDA